MEQGSVICIQVVSHISKNSLCGPQSLNRYAYVSNSPFVEVDPSGLDGEEDCFMADAILTCPLSAGSTVVSAVTGSENLDDFLTGIPFVGNFLDNVPIGTLIGAGELFDDLGQSFGWWGGSTFHGNVAASQSGKNVPSFASTVAYLPLPDPDEERVQQLEGVTNNTPTVLNCLGAAGKANGLQTGLDILSGIPLEGDIATTAQIAIASASTTLSAYNKDKLGTGLSTTGLATTFLGAAGVNIERNGLKLIPVAGTIVSGISVLNDVFGSNGWVATYTSCRNGTHP